MYNKRVARWRGLGSTGDVWTQYIIFVRKGDGTETSMGTTGRSEQEARDVVEGQIADGYYGAGATITRVEAQGQTAALPTIVVNGVRQLDPVGVQAYREAYERGGSSVVEAVAVATQAARTAAERAPEVSTGAPPEAAAERATVARAGFGGKLGLLIAAGLAFAFLRKR